MHHYYIVYEATRECAPGPALSKLLFHYFLFNLCRACYGNHLHFYYIVQDFSKVRVLVISITFFTTLKCRNAMAVCAPPALVPSHV
mmetsp:Transcript_17293/g.24196  ORF Transcript_17293/g.24196 Transcript_17293/m.24196 type:complete len:86 (-) Transcript_17293:32-289(-)